LCDQMFEERQRKPNSLGPFKPQLNHVYIRHGMDMESRTSANYHAPKEQKANISFSLPCSDPSTAFHFPSTLDRGERKSTTTWTVSPTAHHADHNRSSQIDHPRHTRIRTSPEHNWAIQATIGRMYLSSNFSLLRFRAYCSLPKSLLLPITTS